LAATGLKAFSVERRARTLEAASKRIAEVSKDRAAIARKENVLITRHASA
jgi:hypothetical protein